MHKLLMLLLLAAAGTTLASCDKCDTRKEEACALQAKIDSGEEVTDAEKEIAAKAVFIACGQDEVFNTASDCK